MFGTYLLDEHGNPAPCSMHDWHRLFEDPRRILKRDEIGDLSVSTVFLGLDHNFGMSGPPVLWETMIFMDEGTHVEWYDQERYSSRLDAYEGHARAVAKAKDVMATARAVMVGTGAKV